MPRLLKIAILSGATPLLTGVLIYGSWRLTQAEWLMSAGLINIVAGLAMFLAGVICLSMRSTRVVVGDVATRRRFSAIRKLAWVMLIANFPAALLIVHSVIVIKTRYTVTVVNESKTPIDSFMVIGPSVRVELAPIPANGKVTKHFRFSGEGSLEFETRVGQMKTNDLIDGYVTSNLGGANTVRFNDRGGIEVERVSR